jgi:hypothetical protein
LGNFVGKCSSNNRNAGISALIALCVTSFLWPGSEIFDNIDQLKQTIQDVFDITTKMTLCKFVEQLTRIAILGSQSDDSEV